MINIYLIFKIKIRIMIFSFRVKKLKSTMHDIDEYMFIFIYIFKNKQNDIKKLYRILRKIYFVENLKAHILINNIIIDFEKIVINIIKNNIYNNNYEVIVIIINRQREFY